MISMVVDCHILTFLKLRTVAAFYMHLKTLSHAQAIQRSKCHILPQRHLRVDFFGE